MRKSPPTKLVSIVLFALSNYIPRSQEAVRACLVHLRHSSDTGSGGGEDGDGIGSIRRAVARALLKAAQQCEPGDEAGDDCALMLLAELDYLNTTTLLQVSAVNCGWDRLYTPHWGISQPHFLYKSSLNSLHHE
jgi:hypothetical protein